MIQTNTAYMSDPARAGRIIRRFMNVTLREMAQVQDHDYVGYITDRLISVEGLSPEKLLDMTYIELAGLIYNVAGQSQYDKHHCSSQDQQLAFCQCLAGILRDGSQYSIPIRLFMALPLEAFYTALDRLGADGGMMDMMEQFELAQLFCNYQDGYTIENFLFEKLQKLNRPWQPTMSLHAYRDTITSSLKEIGALLVGSFQAALPGQFYAEKIRCKYSTCRREQVIAQPMPEPARDNDKLPM